MQKYSRNCDLFVDSGGLKLLFPILMQKALSDGTPEEQKSVLSQSITILLHLMLFCSQTNKGRLVAKLEEKDFEKIDKFTGYLVDLQAYLAGVEKNKDKFIIRLGDLTTEEAEEAFLAEKLEKGYLTLLTVNFILYTLSVYSPNVCEA